MDKQKNETGKLGELNKMLGDVETQLLYRSLDRTRGEVEHAYDFINQLADDGTIDIECAKCDDEVDPDIANIEA
jgi:DNA invertase Pin-like site-specific DNA recombinase